MKVLVSYQSSGSFCRSCGDVEKDAHHALLSAGANNIASDRSASCQSTTIWQYQHIDAIEEVQKRNVFRHRMLELKLLEHGTANGPKANIGRLSKTNQRWQTYRWRWRWQVFETHNRIKSSTYIPQVSASQPNSSNKAAATS